MGRKSSDSAGQIKKELRSRSQAEKAKLLPRFFKTGPGEYGEGDKFLGVMVPDIRAVVKTHPGTGMGAIGNLIVSKFHEERLTGLLLLVQKFNKADDETQKEIFNFYLAHTTSINNWDLVDLTAPNIVGTYLLGRPRKILYTLSRSKLIWERRIAILATAAFIRKGQFDDTLKLAKVYLNDKHDLMHKAVGWMLREVGKRSKETLTSFLDQYYRKMPRTMLRYAIEKFPEKERRHYLGK